MAYLLSEPHSIPARSEIYMSGINQMKIGVALLLDPTRQKSCWAIFYRQTLLVLPSVQTVPLHQWWCRYC